MLTSKLTKFIMQRIHSLIIYSIRCDLEEACKLQPENEELKRDLNKLKNI